jgi:hypothetical protein
LLLVAIRFFRRFRGERGNADEANCDES